MQAKFSEQRTLRIMALVVGLLALPTLWSWFSPITSTAPAFSSNQKNQRGIASIAAEQQESHVQKFSRPVTLEWDLSKSDFAKEIDGTHLRLKGSAKSGRLPSSVTNKTNGFTAAVFESDAGFSTDFIELNEGPNEIKVESTDGKGQKITRTLRVTRPRAPASEE